MSMSKVNNEFLAILSFLNVKHTKEYANRLYNNNPNKHNMLGFVQMLNEYNINSECIKVKEPMRFNLQLITPPFIAQLNTGFAVVSNINSDSITFYLNKDIITTDIVAFTNSWSGNLLLTQLNIDSIEPNYTYNIKKQVTRIMKKCLLCLIILFLTISYLETLSKLRLCDTILLFVNVIGIFIGTLIYFKQYRKSHIISEKLCSIISPSGCNNVMSSPASLLWGDISLSEIGLGYFVSNIIIILIAPSLLAYTFIVNILSLPFTLWSIWYQWFKIKDWCMLCILIQIIQWGLFIVYAVFANSLMLDMFSLMDAIITCCIYGMTTLGLHYMGRQYVKVNELSQYILAYNSLKNHPDVFRTLLNKDSKSQINFCDSQIIFGNKMASTVVTVFSNPHCKPCSLMHKRLTKILDKYSNDICVQYVFSSFGEQWNDSSKFLIRSYLYNKIETAREIFNEWFDHGMDFPKEMMKKYSYSDNEAAESDEFQKHITCIQSNNISETPTIFINGNRLPDIYSIEDVIYHI